MFEIHSVLDLIFWLLAIGAFAMSAYAMVHALRTPARAFAVTGKQTKQLWTVILGFAVLFSFAAGVQYLPVLSIFTIASVIAPRQHSVWIFAALSLSITFGGSFASLAATSLASAADDEPPARRFLPTALACAGAMPCFSSECLTREDITASRSGRPSSA